MTENEAIEFMKRYLDADCYTDKCVNAHNMAINALEEVQQYRAIGTIEECRAAVERQNPRAAITEKEDNGIKNIHVMHAVGTWVGQLEHFLLVIAGNVVRNWIGVMKNDFSIVHKFLSTNPYSH